MNDLFYAHMILLLFRSNRKSSTVPDSVAMTMLARKRPSPVIQVTVKQTETDPGLIGVVSDYKKPAPWTYTVGLRRAPLLITCF